MSTMEERTALWSGLIAEQRASGVSQAAWRRERNISFSTFCNWRARLNKQSGGGNGWVSMLSSVRPSQQTSIALHVGSGRIDLSPGFDADLLREIVTALTAC